MASFEKKDATLPAVIPALVLQRHASFLANYNATNNPYEFAVTEHLRMNGMYWSLTALALMDSLHLLDAEAIVKFVKDCQHLDQLPLPATGAPGDTPQAAEAQKRLAEIRSSQYGGFGASLGHDAHLLSTLSAVQILCLYDRLGEIDTDATVKYVASLQQPDGSFVGDVWGEVDTRFSFCAVACLSLLKRLDAIDLDKAVAFVKSTANFDGGFGRLPGSESHAAQVYVCLGTLSIAGVLDETVDKDQLGWWLAERQMTRSGGLNGRPEKLPDVCYSWWVLSSMCMLNRLHWIDADKLYKFILACQDDEGGGIADRPDDMADPYHTLFGLAGLSLLSRYAHETSGDVFDAGRTIKQINPVYCMPQEVIDRVLRR